MLWTTLKRKSASKYWHVTLWTIQSTNSFLWWQVLLDSSQKKTITQRLSAFSKKVWSMCVILRSGFTTGLTKWSKWISIRKFWVLSSASKKSSKCLEPIIWTMTRSKIRSTVTLKRTAPIRCSLTRILGFLLFSSEKQSHLTQDPFSQFYICYESYFQIWALVPWWCTTFSA